MHLIINLRVTLLSLPVVLIIAKVALVINEEGKTDIRKMISVRLGCRHSNSGMLNILGSDCYICALY